MGETQSAHQEKIAATAQIPGAWLRDSEPPYRPPVNLAGFAPYVCEFIGTFILVLTVGYVCINGNALWGPTAIAIVLMAMVYALGSISGGHLNPAVSITMGLLGKVPGGWRKVAAYVCTQLLAGIAAGAVVNTVFPQAQSIPFGPKDPYGWYGVMAVEVIYTGMLCFVVANCAGSRSNNPEDDKNAFYGLAIGFVIVAAGYACGSISGAALNPAVSVGIDLAFWSDGLLWGFAYAFYQVLGAVVAAGLYFIIRSQEFAQDWSPQAELPIWTKALCEFLGTFILVLTVGLNLVTRSKAVAWSAAAALMCMIYSLGDVSGGHFNPAVTLGVLLCGKDRNVKALALYPAAQAAGAAAAGLVYSTLHRYGEFSKVTFMIGPLADYKWSQAMVAEFAFTFVLTFVVLSVACTSIKNSMTKHLNHAAMAIGACVTAGGFAVGNVSGGVLNPAVALGITVANMFSWGSAPLPSANFANYALCELAGGATAACVFFATHPHEVK